MDSEVLEPPAISVRRMRDGEEHALKTLAGHASPLLGRIFFPTSPSALVAERDGKLVGAVVLRTFWLPGGRKGGVMFWLMSDPEARGLGVGGRLVGDALRYFEGQDCGEVFAGVEGYNTSSANIFAARGFTILSFGEQLRRYGLLGTFLLCLKTSHLGDVGHFLWARPGAVRPDNPVLQWWVGTLMSILVFLLAGWRGEWLRGDGLATILGAALIVVALFGVREMAMRLAARPMGLRVRHRAWESAFPLGLGVALAFGIFLPAPGSLYPRQGMWRYRNLLSKLGPIAFAGALVVLVFACAAWVLARFGGLSPEVMQWLSIAHRAGLMLAVVDVLLPFFPFASFDGRRIWDWNRAVWGVLAVAVVGLFLMGR
jgi:ribosomal protein S18 acetylase RimI-like enzyme/cation transporter-like permease